MFPISWHQMSTLETIHSIGLLMYKEIVGFMIIVIIISLIFTHLLDADVLAECIRKRTRYLRISRNPYF